MGKAGIYVKITMQYEKWIIEELMGVGSGKTIPVRRNIMSKNMEACTNRWSWEVNAQILVEAKWNVNFNAPLSLSLSLSLIHHIYICIYMCHCVYTYTQNLWTSYLRIYEQFIWEYIEVFKVAFLLRKPLYTGMWLMVQLILQNLQTVNVKKKSFETIYFKNPFNNNNNNNSNKSS